MSLYYFLNLERKIPIIAGKMETKTMAKITVEKLFFTTGILPKK